MSTPFPWLPTEGPPAATCLGFPLCTQGTFLLLLFPGQGTSSPTSWEAQEDRSPAAEQRRWCCRGDDETVPWPLIKNRSFPHVLGDGAEGKTKTAPSRQINTDAHTCTADKHTLAHSTHTQPAAELGWGGLLESHSDSSEIPRNDHPPTPTSSGTDAAKPDIWAPSRQCTWPGVTGPGVEAQEQPWAEGGGDLGDK